MPESDLALLIDAARQAGDIAKRYHMGDALGVTYKPGDAGPVTQADLAVDLHLKQMLTQARPDYGWMSEESEDTADRLSKRRVFVVDPIDGTRSFIDGSSTWSHSLAIVEDGVPVVGVVYLPLRDRLFTGQVGQGAHLNGEPLSLVDGTAHTVIDDLTGTAVLATKPSFEPKHWRKVPDLKRSHRPSLAYRMSLVAQGRYAAMFTFRPSWEWDIAAGAVILAEAGARVTDRTGQPLQFNSDARQTDGVIAAAPNLHKALLEQTVYGSVA